MVRLRRARPQRITEDEEFTDSHARTKVTGFHPHCFVQSLAVAESRQFDQMYVLAHTPVLGENESEA
jgi:hypothetical protein